MVRQSLDFRRIFMLSDIHMGVRSNSLEWLENQVDYFNNFFIPLLKEKSREGDIFFILGDLFDNRQSIDILVSNTAEDIIAEIAKILPVHILCGNHDMYKKLDNKVNSLNKFKHFKNVHVYTDNTILTNSSGNSILVLPYSEDYDVDLGIIENSGCDYLFAHADILGMKLDNGKDVKKGLNLSKSNIKKVFSGHIHKRQEKNKVIYIGSPYHTSRSDIGDTKGVYLFDAVENKQEFFHNHTSPLFKKILLSQILETPLGEVKDMLKNNYVDIIVPLNLASQFNISKFVEKLASSQYKRIESELERRITEGTEVQSVTMDDSKTLLDMIEDYIDNNIEDASVRDVLKEKNKKYYNTANTDE